MERNGDRRFSGRGYPGFTLLATLATALITRVTGQPWGKRRAVLKYPARSYGKCSLQLILRGSPVYV